MNRILFSVIVVFCAAPAMAANNVILHADLAGIQISRHIYGHFAEHLGRFI